MMHPRELARKERRTSLYDDFAFLRLFLGGVGNDDAGLRLLFAFEAANDDAVM
jgi:hypothetical protein